MTPIILSVVLIHILVYCSSGILYGSIVGQCGLSFLDDEVIIVWVPSFRREVPFYPGTRVGVQKIVKEKILAAALSLRERRERVAR